MNEIDFDAKVAFGQVVEVRFVRSRSVSQIIIEVDSHSHLAASNLLFEKTALVVPFFSEEELKTKNVQAPYGVHKLSKFMAPNAPTEMLNGRPLCAERDAPAPPPPTSGAIASSMLGGRVDADAVKGPPNLAANAAILCEEPTFWRFLAVKTAQDVTNEEQAIHALRLALNIASRAELNKDAGAGNRFRELRRDYERSLS